MSFTNTELFSLLIELVRFGHDVGAGLVTFHG